ncbi:uncharacterized protein CIMG_08897 [Coccidioides immitis RS]|uniref:Uncharacterized protein n=3 Tax=Coccidioides immitis TaxID=5501 RepID=J3K6F6_COCIM|nr:uncharacterized protein CIMG_08897 [Coccidioides immitis RS]EAS30151.3 hypothetical protein CIMG_08897 [Coccidioides immitis RS]KMP07100.1 hypothetical protein CIRG_06781 [Coccidioides immitis RMSCC 2394]KMU86825.1 hypothetical protein CIHG_04614 [Coccidioides immitis H538.4]
MDFLRASTLSSKSQAVDRRSGRPGPRCRDGAAGELERKKHGPSTTIIITTTAGQSCEKRKKEVARERLRRFAEQLNRQPANPLREKPFSPAHLLSQPSNPASAHHVC